MTNRLHIHVENFRYHLPEENIARYPLPERDESRLLTYQGGEIDQFPFTKLPAQLPTNSFLVFNNTRVIQARLHFYKTTGARIEIFCLEPVDPVEHQQSFLANRCCTWKCLVGNVKKWKSGLVTLETTINDATVVLEASLELKTLDSFIIRFQWNNDRFTFGEIIENSGSTPIPPYLNRDAEKSDKERYQTIYGRSDGSVAAPTAGLHFTESMMKQLSKAGIRTAELTLHVGAGTFVPVKANNARDHNMHAEKVLVSRILLEELIRHTDGTIAVGTTSLRSLESLYWLGAKLFNRGFSNHTNLNIAQWENEDLPTNLSINESLSILIDFCNKHELDHLNFSTQLMIVPGYKFKLIKGLITNFHLPGSTLLLLIAALIGNDWKKVYNYALNHQFRFLSYGDSSLLIPG